MNYSNVRSLLWRTAFVHPAKKFELDPPKPYCSGKTAFFINISESLKLPKISVVVNMSDMEAKHSMIQQMDPDVDKKVAVATNYFNNIINSVNRDECKTPREYMKKCIEKLIYFMKDSKEGLDRTVLTLIYSMTNQKLQDFNAAAREEERVYGKNKRRSTEELAKEEDKEQKMIEEYMNEMSSITSIIED